VLLLDGCGRITATAQATVAVAHVLLMSTVAGTPDALSTKRLVRRDNLQCIPGGAGMGIGGMSHKSPALPHLERRWGTIAWRESRGHREGAEEAALQDLHVKVKPKLVKAQLLVGFIGTHW
jgi:hypothetical protein